VFPVLRRRRAAAPYTVSICALMTSAHMVCALTFCGILLAAFSFGVAEPAAAQGVGAASTVVTQPPSTTTTVKKKPRRVPSTVPGTVVRVVTAKESIGAEPAAAPSASASASDDVWAKLRKCESGGRYDINTGNGFYGAYQFALSTWRRLGYEGYPHHAAPAVQDEAAKKLQAAAGWGQWPACSRKLGLR
jgi:Transglycosylase-like domain